MHKVRNISFGLGCSQKESGQATSRSSPMDQYAKIGTLLCSLSLLRICSLASDWTWGEPAPRRAAADDPCIPLDRGEKKVAFSAHAHASFLA